MKIKRRKREWVDFDCLPRRIRREIVSLEEAMRKAGVGYIEGSSRKCPYDMAEAEAKTHFYVFRYTQFRGVLSVRCVQCGYEFDRPEEEAERRFQIISGDVPDTWLRKEIGRK